MSEFFGTCEGIATRCRGNLLECGNILIQTMSPDTQYALKIKAPFTFENNKNNRLPIKVSVPEHIRRLPEGQKHSQRKVELAAKLGYELPENKTIVNAYSYERRCA